MRRTLNLVLKYEEDIRKAKNLLAEAGYPDGEDFPVVRLLINRNDQQRIVAQSIAAMWRAALNIQTEIIMKSWEEYEATVKAGDYDVVRRGIVMQTTDELTNLRMLFQQDSQPSSELQTMANVHPSRSREANGHGRFRIPGTKGAEGSAHLFRVLLCSSKTLCFGF